MAMATLATVSTGSYFALKSSVVHAEAKDPVYPGAVEDPSTRILFPVYLNTNSDWKRLVGLGVRQVSFLKLNVYVLGLYMRSEDIGELQKDAKWKDFNKTDFLENEDLALSLLDQPVDVSIRIVPVRNTNTQHLRDGFTRSLLQRMRQQSKTMTEEEETEILEAIRDFKTKFVNAKVKKDTEFVFTKTRKGEFKMEYEGKDMGTVNNKWLAINFIMTYLNPTAPASEDALLDIATGFDNLMHPSSINTN
ncbi:chalcone-flavanone isomerase [Halteromyces radiatus]|uniref:chalcone-flavanone isomerase n=1 Tax=Halteromyces radiatus TaxID=101107 RepID=UPI00221FD0B9|nr:chalcone-flavanone isomerase [Halteromyces radiatus]KAI8089377.1 chalcone-flavanone isomerase [Halteromyces radiatus]